RSLDNSRDFPEGRGCQQLRAGSPFFRAFCDAGPGRRLVMTETGSLVPLNEGNDVYLVLDELMTFGLVWRELSAEAANEQTVVERIATGGLRAPRRFIVLNTGEGWWRNETVNMGFKLLEMGRGGRVLVPAANELVERTTGQVPTLLA